MWLRYQSSERRYGALDELRDSEAQVKYRDIAVVVLLAFFAARSATAQSVAEPRTIILTLGSLSHVSFNDRLILPIASPGAIKLLAYPPDGTGVAALRVEPGAIGQRTQSLGAGEGQLRAELLG